MRMNNYFAIGEKGLFSYIYGKDSTLDFIPDLDTAKKLDLLYLEHSGDKRATKFFKRLVAEYGFDTACDKQAELILQMFKLNWVKIYDAYITDYSPLENYNMIENEKIKSKIKNTSKVNGGMYAFNSSDVSPTNDASSESISEGNKEDNDRDLTRHGNIGVTTSQQMLQSEIELRKYKFYNVLFSNVDSLVALKIY